MKRRLAIAFTLGLTIVLAPASSAGSVSPSLLDWANGAGLSDTRDVIVQLNKGLTGRDIVDLFGCARLKRDFKKLGMVSMTMTPEAVKRFAGDSRVLALTEDAEVTSMGKLSGSLATTYSLLERTTGADEAKKTFRVNGSGVGIAVLDSGTGTHMDVQPTAATDVLPSELRNKNEDSYGHGTHVAGVAVGTGKASFQYEANYTGMAPGASLISVRVLDGEGRGEVSWVLAGIDWVLANRTYKNIKVVNMSLGMPSGQSYKTDPLCQATKKLYDAGIVTVVAAGNYGKSPTGEIAFGSITSPGISPWVITVGAVNDQGTAARSDDIVASYSSRGPTRSFDSATGRYDHLMKPEIVATGNHIVAPEVANNWIVTSYPQFNLEDSSTNKSYMFLNGTSMATPVVSGTVALMLQANPALKPSQVKAILMYTAQTLPSFSVFEQGSGELNVEGAVRLAWALKGAPLGTATYGTVLLEPSKMPAPFSTLSGQFVIWSQGNVLVQRTTTAMDGSTTISYVHAGGVLFCEGILFAEGIVFAEGIDFAECSVKPQGVIFAERGALIERGVIVAGSLPQMTSSGSLNASAVIFAEGATAGRANLVNSNALIFAEGVVFAEGVIFAERTSSDTRLNFAGQAAFGSDANFAQGMLFAEDELKGLFCSSNNVLVAGESFTY